MLEETGTQSLLSEDDMKQYLELALQEVRKQGTRSINSVS